MNLHQYYQYAIWSKSQFYNQIFYLYEGEFVEFVQRLKIKKKPKPAAEEKNGYGSEDCGRSRKIGLRGHFIFSLCSIYAQ